MVTATIRPTGLGRPFAHWSIRTLAACLRRVDGQSICIGEPCAACSPAAGSPVTAEPRSMKSIVQERYGPAPEDVLRLAQTDKPTILHDEILVRVHAASVDRGTWHVMAGLPYPIRIAGFGLRRPKSANPGRSLAGTVEAVGTDVTGFKPGDEVFGISSGSFAEYACARADKLAPKPANLSFGQAAAVPISGLTALQAVRDHG